MKSKDLERLARGPNPRNRVAVPQPGKRCPRHHGSVDPTSPAAKPCLLCRPDLVLIEHGGTKVADLNEPVAPASVVDVRQGGN